MQPNTQSRALVIKRAPIKQQNLQTKKKKTQRPKTSNTQLVRNNRTIKQCTFHYWKAIADPFGARISQIPACIPDVLDIPSQKASFLVRGTVGIGTQGFGMIIANPKINSSAVSTIAYSLTNYIYSSVSFGSLALATVGSYPYTGTALASARTVACGLRVRYLGTELNRSGRIIPVYFSGDDYLKDGETTATVMQRPSVYSFPTTRAWHGTTYVPTLQDDYQYHNGGWDSVTTNGNSRMAILLEGVPGNTFEFEYCVHLELISSADQRVATTSQSHSDIVGISEVRDFFGSLPVSEVGQGLWNKAVGYIKQQGIGIAADVVGKGMKLLM